MHACTSGPVTARHWSGYGPFGRLRAIESLNLAFLVDAEHNRPVGRIEVEPDNVDHFLSELWIVGELEWARQMWLEPMFLPDALHGRMTDADLRSQHPRAPVRCVLGFSLAVRVTIASRTSALIGFLPARAPLPLSLSRRSTPPFM